MRTLNKILSLGLMAIAPILSAKEVTFEATEDAQQNAINLRNAGNTESTDTLIVNIPDGIYDIRGTNYNHLPSGNIIYRGITNPFPKNPLEANEYPNGAIIKDELGISTNPGTTLENLIFDARGQNWDSPETPFQFVDIGENEIKLKNCYFIGNKNDPNYYNNQRAIQITYRDGRTTDCLISNCYVRDFNFGTEISDIKSKWRGNIFRDCNYGFIGNSGADLGTETEHGENVFYKNDKIALIMQGNGYPMKWGYFYGKDGNLINDQTEIESGIVDRRVRLASVGSDIEIYPFHTTAHHLFPIVSAVIESWRMYE